MDQDTERAVSGLKMQLAQLMDALGARTPDQAQAAVEVLAQQVGQLEAIASTQFPALDAQVGTIGTQMAQMAAAIGALQGAVQALAGQMQALAGQVQALAAQVAALPPPA